MGKLDTAIDPAEVDATTAAFERLRAAIESVNAELDKLGGKPHGGIKINAVGDVVSIDVAATPNENLMKEIQRGINRNAQRAVRG